MQFRLLFVVVGCALGACPVVKEVPPRFDYGDLTDDESFSGIKHQFDSSLSLFGIVAVDMPADFGALRAAALTAVHHCIADTPDVARETFADGTVRSSLATAMDSPLEGCEGTDLFRGVVHAVVHAFAKRLGDVYDLAGPLLASEERTYDDVVSIVDEEANHLEHFHSYYSDSTTEGAKKHTTQETIELHTDQGLFIAFVQPENFFDDENENLNNEKDTPRGAKGHDKNLARFEVRLRDGSTVDVPLDSPAYANTIFFALGDGVEQFVNARVGGSGPSLRPCPHSLTMADSYRRTWYGLMVLPPPEAVNPVLGLTYETLRQLALGTTAESSSSHTSSSSFSSPSDYLNKFSAGCSRKLFARELAATSCAENQLYCWARCMDPTDLWGEPASLEICRDKGYDFYNCTDPLGQISDGTEHGDFYPGCTNHQHLATEPPTIAPADEEACAQETEEDPEDYFGSVALEYGGRSWAPIDPPINAGSLQWNLIKNNTALELKQSFPGRLGWFAIGLANPGGGHNGMNGAPIVMGIVDNTQGDDVDTYRIDDDNSAFRWWNTPTTAPDLANGKLQATECHASMSFDLSTFGNTVDLDLADDACNTLLWGVSTDTQIAYDPDFLLGGYHELRGFVYVNFHHPQGACCSFPRLTHSLRRRHLRRPDPEPVDLVDVVVVVQQGQQPVGHHHHRHHRLHRRRHGFGPRRRLRLLPVQKEAAQVRSQPPALHCETRRRQGPRGRRDQGS